MRGAPPRKGGHLEPEIPAQEPCPSPLPYPSQLPFPLPQADQAPRPGPAPRVDHKLDAAVSEATASRVDRSFMSRRVADLVAEFGDDELHGVYESIKSSKIIRRRKFRESVRVLDGRKSV